MLFDIEDLEDLENLINKGSNRDLLRMRETKLESFRLVALVVSVQLLNLLPPCIYTIKDVLV